MDYSDLARLIAPALSSYFPSFASTRDLGRGTAFPLTADVRGGLQSGDQFWRTDLGFACYYDGTRWLTREEYACVLTTAEAQAASFTATTTNVRSGLVRDDYVVVFTRGQANLFVGATNNAANYITYNFKNDAASATFWTFDTKTDTANANNGHTTTTWTQPAAGFEFVRLDIVVTGAPSAQFPRAPVLWYRMIIP